ncbi:MAG: hypothetical protein PWP54_304 [Thermosipho sp. (in: thermotogales)]|nr:hypothetical protein [Thermosipho sp. (in: thermotogales)]MDN5324808.1 hypothetical protein [Thermosipho sp. (in: thermotogales)]
MNYYLLMKKNVTREYIYSFLNNFNLLSTVWMLYLAYKGMSLTQIGLLEGIFHLTSFLMEIPTGSIADVFGRKLSRILGRFFWIISSITMLFGTNFFHFSIAMSLMALSYNLESGAGQALLYDSLKATNSEDEYMKIAGKIELLTQIGMISGYLLGGYIAKIKYEYVFIYSSLLGLIALLQSLTFKEPKIFEEKEKTTFKDVFINAFISFVFLKKKKDVLYLIFFSEGILVVGTIFFFYLQNYFLSLGINQFQIGIIMAFSGIFSAIMSYFTHRVEKKLGLKRLLIFIPFSYSLLSLGLLSNIPYVFNMLLSGLIGVLYIVYIDYVNKKIPSEKRATILSMCSMVYSLYMIVFFPLFGKIADEFSFKVSFIFISVILMIFSIINGILLIKK